VSGYLTYRGWRLVRAFLLPVAGESFANADGTSRQDILGRCAGGEFLRLDPEPDNPHDRNAVKICRLNGEQIGYVPAEHAAEIGEFIAPEGILAVLYAVTGGTRAKPSRGAVVQIQIFEK
jgi:hypothetical protein